MLMLGPPRLGKTMFARGFSGSANPDGQHVSLL